MKNHLICVMEAVESLMEEGFQPERDVYLCFGHNEEIVCSKESGADEIVKVLRSRGIHLDSVLDEGSALLRLDVKGLIHTYIAAVGVAEKGYADMKLTVHDKGGHQSTAVWRSLPIQLRTLKGISLSRICSRFLQSFLIRSAERQPILAEL